VTWDTSTLARTALGSDNFPTTWADDDNVYTLWGDGAGFNATAYESGIEPYRVGLGVARISGDPASFSAVNVFGGKDALNPDTFGGKAYGIVSIASTLYMLQGPQNSPAGDESGTWDAAKETTVGVSYDHGATWWRTGVVLSAADGFCSPGFLNYGKDYSGGGSYVYIYGRDCAGYDGASAGAMAKISLARAPVGSITDRTSYEFFSGTNGSSAWVTDPASRRPVFTNPVGHPEPGCFDAPSAIYNPGLDRYLLVVTHGTSGSPSGGLGIYDGATPWGPWTTAYYADNWMGSDHMFYANIPTKWLNGVGDTFYLVFSGYNPDAIAEDAYQHMKGTLVLSADAGPTQDSGADAGSLDGGVDDAGAPDAGAGDAGVSDARVSDAGAGDAGVSDAGVSDAGVSDAGVSDAGQGLVGGCGCSSVTSGAAGFTLPVLGFWPMRRMNRRRARCARPDWRIRRKTPVHRQNSVRAVIVDLLAIAGHGPAPCSASSGSSFAASSRCFEGSAHSWSRSSPSGSSSRRSKREG
jgi:hypothetical protein